MLNEQGRDVSYGGRWGTEVIRTVVRSTGGAPWGRQWSCERSEIFTPMSAASARRYLACPWLLKAKANTQTHTHGAIKLFDQAFIINHAFFSFAVFILSPTDAFIYSHSELKFFILLYSFLLSSETDFCDSQGTCTDIKNRMKMIYSTPYTLFRILEYTCTWGPMCGCVDLHCAFSE